MSAEVGKIHVRPRAWGLGFIAVAIVMLLAAINYGNNLVFLLTFVLIALMANSLWQTRRSLKQISVQPAGIEPRLAGEPGWFHIVVSSRAGHPAFYLETIERDHSVRALDPYHPHDADSTGCDLGLEKDDEKHIHLLVAAQQRGYLRAPLLELSCHYPFGLFAAWRIITPKQGQWILPRSRPANLSAEQDAQAESGTQAAQQGDPTYLRPYQPGDSIRHIVFKHYAKTGVLVSRQQESEHEPDIPHILDYQKMSGDQNTRIEQLAGLVRKLSDARQSWVLYLPKLAPIEYDAQQSGGQNVQQQALEQLAIYGLATDVSGFNTYDS